jgi:cytochrome c biogenesis protein CcmG, thiol:disulfide interchange protein DsbE
MGASEVRKNGAFRWQHGRTAAVLWTAVLLLILVLAAGQAEAALRIGDPAPSMTLSHLDGTPAQIPEVLRGKVAVLHFWQIGCSSCRQEMPAMNELYGQYRRKGIEVLAINIGQKKEAVKVFAAELGISYPILIDAGGKSAATYGVTDVPRTYVVDRNGIVRYRILGGATPEMLKKLVLSLF